MFVYEKFLKHREIKILSKFSKGPRASNFVLKILTLCNRQKYRKLSDGLGTSWRLQNGGCWNEFFVDHSLSFKSCFESNLSEFLVMVVRHKASTVHDCNYQVVCSTCYAFFGWMNKNLFSSEKIWEFSMFLVTGEKRNSVFSLFLVSCVFLAFLYY